MDIVFTKPSSKFRVPKNEFSYLKPASLPSRISRIAVPVSPALTTWYCTTIPNPRLENKANAHVKAKMYFMKISHHLLDRKEFRGDTISASRALLIFWLSLRPQSTAKCMFNKTKNDSPCQKLDIGIIFTSLHLKGVFQPILCLSAQIANSIIM